MWSGAVPAAKPPIPQFLQRTCVSAASRRIHLPTTTPHRIRVSSCAGENERVHTRAHCLATQVHVPRAMPWRSHSTVIVARKHYRSSVRTIHKRACRAINRVDVFCRVPSMCANRRVILAHVKTARRQRSRRVIVARRRALWGVDKAHQSGRCWMTKRRLGTLSAIVRANGSWTADITHAARDAIHRMQRQVNVYLHRRASRPVPVARDLLWKASAPAAWTLSPPAMPCATSVYHVTTPVPPSATLESAPPV
jgi:hypothetical protein